MRPRVRSYGESSTRTRSPGRIRMKFIRSLPLMCANTRWPFSSSTANIVLGSGSITVPSTSIASFLATGVEFPFLVSNAGPVDRHTNAQRIKRPPIRQPELDRGGHSDRGQDLCAMLCNGDRVLEMRGERAVAGDDRPIVGQ